LEQIFALFAQAPAPAAPQGPGFNMFVPLALIAVVFYFMILRPQKKQQKEQEELRNAVKKGDRVVTIGGAHGVVAGVDTTRNTVSVLVDRNVKIDFSKSAIATITRKEDIKDEEPAKADAKTDAKAAV
jgi:preprotein translocase subunit YajC